MTVAITAGVWPAWREQAEQHEEPGLPLLIVPVGDHGAAARALGEAVREVQTAFEHAHERDREPPFVGEWSWLQVADGVVVVVVECDDLQAVLPAVAAALERRGVAGRFAVYDWPKVATPARTVDLLECRIRIRGTRVRRGPRSYRWQPDPAAHEAILAFAQRWCKEAGPEATLSLRKGMVGPLPVAPGEDLRGRILDAVTEREQVEMDALTAQGFRSFAARPVAGGVSLVAGGGFVGRAMLAELTAVLRDHAALLVYGYIRRGWALGAALSNNGLPDDWPDRPKAQPRGIGFTRQAFDDVFAPDAFGVQLLGPSYASRVPQGLSWRQEQIGDAILLEHVDPATWFDAPFVPFGHMVAPSDRPVPELLRRARMELSPILYTPGALSRAGYVDEEEL